MTSWNPTTTVTIAGNNFTSYTLQGLTITMGRTDIRQQSYAGFSQIILRDLPQDVVNINDQIQISLASTSATVPIFTGYITDLNSVIAASSANVKIVDTTINAVGILSRLASSFANTRGYAEQNDGTRIYNIALDVFGLKWQELNTSLKWTGYTTETWNSVLGVDLTDIDTTGTFTLYSTTANPQEGLTYAQEVATSGQGQLYENGDGTIGYAKLDRRSTYYSTYGATSLNPNYVLSDGITVNKSKYNVINDVTVSYGNPSASVNAYDPNSISTYDRQSQSIETFIKSSVDAQTVADRLVLLNRFPEVKLEGISLRLENSAMTDADRDSLINIFFGQPVKIVGLPEALYSGDFVGYVEGWSWSIDRKGALLSLTLSDISYSASLVEWQDVAITKKWNNISTTLTWIDATLGVA